MRHATSILIASLVLFAALVAFTLFLSATARAQDTSPANTCVPANQAESIRHQLAADYGEAPLGIGIATEDGTQIIELFADPHDGSWTLLAVGPDMACLVAAGARWTIIKRGKPA